jgi:hypothetical protein
VISRLMLWSAGATTAALACAGTSPTQPAPVPALAAETLVTSVYLIGDAGRPDPTGEPVLKALRHDIDSHRSEPVVVFLGDNAYPRGLPEPGRPGRREAEINLATQVGVIASTGSRGFFVPGNHDWAKHGVDGWDAIRRQGRFIDSVGGGAASLEPRGGCPGPAVKDIGPRLRLILLDTQWWLHPGPRPQHPNSGCPTDSDREITDSLRGALTSSRGRMVVVAQHHPLMSGGVHGGYFGLIDHIFPLLEINPSLWIPLPFIGSLYPTARSQGISSQDVESRAYRHMIRSFRDAFRAAPPALNAAGHEHNLQVIEGGPARLHLVSGTGIYGHSGRAAPIDGTVFARNASGFARLDIPRAGRARLAVVTVDSTGRGREVFSTWVE